MLSRSIIWGDALPPENPLAEASFFVIIVCVDQWKRGEE
jgi:hypothetical protein